MEEQIRRNLDSHAFDDFEMNWVKSKLKTSKKNRKTDGKELKNKKSGFARI
jgi:hypothetical protein